MKKISIFLTLCLAFLLIGCKGVVLEEIELSNESTLEFMETVDLEKIIIDLKYSDSSTKSIPVTSDMLSSADIDKLQIVGNHTITINYEKKTLDITINLIEGIKSITPTKEKYTFSLSEIESDFISKISFNVIDLSLNASTVVATSQMITATDLETLKSTGLHEVTFKVSVANTIFDCKVTIEVVKEIKDYYTGSEDLILYLENNTLEKVLKLDVYSNNNCSTFTFLIKIDGENIDYSDLEVILMDTNNGEMGSLLYTTNSDGIVISYVNYQNITEKLELLVINYTNSNITIDTNIDIVDISAYKINGSDVVKVETDKIKKIIEN